MKNKINIALGISLMLIFAATVMVGYAGQSASEVQIVNQPLLAPPVPLPKLNREVPQHDSLRPMQAASCTPSPSPTPTPGES